MMSDQQSSVGTRSRRADALLNSAQSLCTSFANQEESSLENILAHFSTQPETYCLEHGLPRLAPFLGRKFFQGHHHPRRDDDDNHKNDPAGGGGGIQEYFEMIANLLSHQNMVFSDYMVDVEANVVSVRGQADFTWKSTNQTWSEVFIYRLQFDNDDNCHDNDAMQPSPRIKVYEVWADSGAAYLASQGLLPSAVQNDEND